MALVSPGEQITVTDESQYVPGAVGSVPLILLATAQDKTNPSGTVASGTTKANAGKLQVFTSQRELVSALGYPTFQKSAAGTPLHGDERNEYGLLAGYSTLGIGNRIYAIRADIDLNQLTGTAVRPTGTVPDGTNWLDLANTDWGVNEWSATTGTFTKISPTVLTSASQYSNVGGVNVPHVSVGDIGSYAITLSPAGTGAYSNSAWTLFRKSRTNSWNVVGSDNWKASLPTIRGTATNPTVLANATALTVILNTVSITVGSTTVSTSLADVVTAIAAEITTNTGNKLDGVTVAAVDDRIVFTATSASKSNGTDADGKIDISGTALSSLGLVAGSYYSPAISFGTYVQIPAWRSTDATAHPTSSVYIKTTAIGAGANVAIKKYNAATATWTAQAAPLYNHPNDAIYGLDPSGGGYNISAGTIWVRYDIKSTYAGSAETVTYKPYYRRVAGATKVVANVVSAPGFTTSDTFILGYTTIGSSAITNVTVTLGGTDQAAFVAAVLAANVPEITAAIESSGAISITHKYGGSIVLTETTASGTPVTKAGFVVGVAGIQAAPVPAGAAAGTNILELSNWSPLVYTFSVATPTQNPDSGTLWYYSSATDVDIMINTTTGWKGYRNEASDARGYNLGLTDASGVIASASKPTSQSDGSTALVPGDLWLNTSDLENWPKLSRYNGTDWVAIDNADQISQNGIVFADARWSIDGTSDVINGSLPSISSLLSSNYTDLDAPDYRLYPRGTLLFNTRRSGYNVKRFVSNHFTTTNFDVSTYSPTTTYAANDKVVYGGVIYAATGATTGNTPASGSSYWNVIVTNSWTNASGLRNDGSM